MGRVRGSVIDNFEIKVSSGACSIEIHRALKWPDGGGYSLRCNCHSFKIVESRYAIHDNT